VKDYVALARQYEADVIDGRVVVCKWVRLACRRNVRDRERAEAHDPAFPYWFSDAAAVRICVAAESLPHVKGPKAKIVGRDEQGRPLWNPISLEPWQCWVLTTVFGWLRAEDNLRRFRVALVLVPRKNAKSTLAAVVVLYMLTADGESGAECYSAATTREQAKVVAEIAWEMARKSHQFREYFQVKIGAKTTKTLDVLSPLGGKFSALSADAHTLDALNVSLAVVDELHAHRTREVWDVLDTATGARLQPLLLATTTAGVDIGGICHEKMDYLHAILQGTHADEQFWGVNYTIDEGDDWRNLDTLRKANPNYGVSVGASDLARKLTEAKHSSAAVNNFLTKHCNVWVRSESTWMPMDDWHACGNRGLRIEDFADSPSWIGVDLAETRDIAASVIVFKVAPDDYVMFGRYYLPAATVEQSSNAQYSGWVRSGYLTETPGNIADFARIEDDIVDWCRRFNVQEVCFDRALAAAVIQNLQQKLGDEPPVIVIEQSVKTMDPAMKAVERLVLGRHLRHAANPAEAWMASNVVVERNYKDEIYPRKAGGKDSKNKIDGMVALFNAISRAYEPIAEPEPSLSTW
jgi:phage terminase large subunit-like protein